MDRRLRNLQVPVHFTIHELRNSDIALDQYEDIMLDIVKRSLYPYNVIEDSVIDVVLTEMLRNAAGDTMRIWDKSGIDVIWIGQLEENRVCAVEFLRPIVKSVLENYEKIMAVNGEVAHRVHDAVYAELIKHPKVTEPGPHPKIMADVMKALRANPDVFLNETIFDAQEKLFYYTMQNDEMDGDDSGDKGPLTVSTIAIRYVTAWLTVIPNLDRALDVRNFIMRHKDNLKLSELQEWLQTSVASSKDVIRPQIRATYEGDANVTPVVDDRIWDPEIVGDAEHLYTGDEGNFHDFGNLGSTDDPRTGQRTYTGDPNGGILTRHAEGSELEDDKIYAFPERNLIAVCMAWARKLPEDPGMHEFMDGYVKLITNLGITVGNNDPWMIIYHRCVINGVYGMVVKHSDDFLLSDDDTIRNWVGWMYYHAILQEMPIFAQKYEIWHRPFLSVNITLLETIVHNAVHGAAKMWKTTRAHLGPTETQLLLEPASKGGMLHYAIANAFSIIYPEMDDQHRERLVHELMETYQYTNTSEDEIENAICSMVMDELLDPAMLRLVREELFGKDEESDEMTKLLAIFADINESWDEDYDPDDDDDEDEDDDDDDDDLDDDDDDLDDEDDDDEEDDEADNARREAIARHVFGVKCKEMDPSKVEYGDDEDGGGVVHIFHTIAEADYVRESVKKLLPKEIKRRYHCYDPDRSDATPEAFLASFKFDFVLMTVNFSVQLTTNALMDTQDWASIMASHGTDFYTINAAYLRKDHENPIIMANRILENEPPKYQWSHDAVRMIVDHAMRYAYAIQFMTPKKFSLRTGMYQRTHSPEECQKIALSMVDKYIKECRDHNSIIGAEDAMMPVFGFDTVLAASGKNPILYFEENGFPNPTVMSDQPTDFIL